MTTLVEGLCAELSAEEEALDERVADLDEATWARATPAAGWSIGDQVSHLAFFEQTATVALTDPPAFARHAKELRSFIEDGAGDDGAGPDTALFRSLGGAGVLERWREARVATRTAAIAAEATDPKARVPWYGPPMSVASFITARLMETWAHGVDVTDTLGQDPVVSDRLRHVILIGIKARGYAFPVHGVEDPGGEVRFEATTPSGDRWSWGPDDATDSVTGSALDLALLFTQRRHRNDTDLTITGPTAEAWMAIAQAFAGPAGPGRPPLGGVSGTTSG